MPIGGINNVSFNAITPEETERAKALINTSDEQLQTLARTKAILDIANSKTVKSGKVFSDFLPIADSFLIGATTKGPLSNKIKGGLDQAKDWAFFIAVTAIYNKAVNGIVNNVPFLKQFREDHPAMYGIGYTVGGVAAGSSGVHLGNKAWDAIFTKPGSKAKTVGEKVSGLIDDLDNGYIGKQVNKFIKWFPEKMPKTAKAASFIATWTLPILCVGYLVSIFTKLAGLKNKEKDNYIELKQVQLDAAKQLLTQNQQ